MMKPITALENKAQKFVQVIFPTNNPNFLPVPFV